MVNSFLVFNRIIYKTIFEGYSIKLIKAYVYGRCMYIYILYGRCMYAYIYIYLFSIFFIIFLYFIYIF